jgi:alkanesulfonate monooxygenase SsuD/methylene tetrahydromethanopterin reductase-like flavin-dependent oxidoreductase (luciferase family)
MHGFAVPGGLPVSSRQALDLFGIAAQRGVTPLFSTEVSVNDALVLLGAVAVRCPDVQLGVGIVPLGSRSVPAIAMAAATVAGLSEHPFLLGVGVSTAPIVEGWHGAPWQPGVGETRDRLRALRRVLDGERRGSFRLAAPPGERVEVLLGALGPRMVEIGQHDADGVICNLTPPDHLPPSDDGARTYAYLWVAADQAGMRAARRDLVAYATAGPYARHFRRLGFGEVVDEVDALRAAGRLRDAPDRLPVEFLDRFVVRPDRLAAVTAAVQRAGAVAVVLPFVPRDADPSEAVERVLDADAPPG